ncbi:hypothetical protein OROMI_015986 [Orobanche minor]
MRTPCCHTFLAFILKFLNFLQASVGVAIIVYSAYMLSQWQHHNHQFNPTDTSGAPRPADVVSTLNLVSGVVFYRDSALRFDLHSLPAPWFIYAFMGIGILVCCITLVGNIGAEAINVLISDSELDKIIKSLSEGVWKQKIDVDDVESRNLKVGLVAFIALDHHWEKDIPFDPTGELDHLRTFIQDNVDVFMWVGIAIVIIQVLSLLFAIILRSLVSSQREDDDIEGDYDFRSCVREPMLAPYSSQTSVSARGDSDIWSSRIREKYGLNNGDAKNNALNQNPSFDAKQ